MITVSDLLLHPLFSEFELVSDNTGLSNVISGTGIFEWETPEIINETFDPGEFVITTLANMQDHPEASIAGINALIEKDVAAIAVKKIHTNMLDADIIEYANSHHIAIFTFSGTFFDDIIFTIKSLLATGDLNGLLRDKVKALLNEADPEIQQMMIKQLNPSFADNCICCCCIPKAKKSAAALEKFWLSHIKYYKEQPSVRVIRCNNCILVIYTSSNTVTDLNSGLSGFLSEISLSPESFRSGISETLPIKNLAALIEESVQAAYSSVICNEDKTAFSEIGIMQIIIPNMHTRWVSNFYKTINKKLTVYDKNHNTNLHETLITYIYSEGDVKLTAKQLYQHGNTIRYRLEKIKTVLGLSDSSDIYIQLFAYAKLHKLYSIFDGENLI